MIQSSVSISLSFRNFLSFFLSSHVGEIAFKHHVSVQVTVLTFCCCTVAWPAGPAEWWWSCESGEACEEMWTGTHSLRHYRGGKLRVGATRGGLIKAFLLG